VTKQLHKLAHVIQAQILAEETPPFRDIRPVLRDAWASLYRWHRDAGERVWRIAEERPPLAPDLPLATAPTHGPACCYTGPERDEWIIVARHAAGETVYVSADPESGYAYSAPQITYVTGGEQIGSGAINLTDQPTPSQLYLMAGKQGARWLSDDDIAPEEKRLMRALRHWYNQACRRIQQKT
jgi:hypothetical protein